MNGFLRILSLITTTKVVSSFIGIAHGGSYAETKPSDSNSELTRKWSQTYQVRSSGMSANIIRIQPITTQAAKTSQLRDTARVVLILRNAALGKVDSLLTSVSMSTYGPSMG